MWYQWTVCGILRNSTHFGDVGPRCILEFFDVLLTNEGRFLVEHASAVIAGLNWQLICDYDLPPALHFTT